MIMNIRPFRHIERRKSRKIKVGDLFVGGDAPITVQTMTNTLTTDVDATLEQIALCVEAGADIIRVSCPDEASTKALALAFGLFHVQYMRSSELGVIGKASQRVVDICSLLNATHYITGHGARNYMDHNLFENKGIEVEYINYGLKPYPQHSGNSFQPYVSALDCIANCGLDAHKYLGGSRVNWKSFLHESMA